MPNTAVRDKTQGAATRLASLLVQVVSAIKARFLEMLHHVLISDAQELQGHPVSSALFTRCGSPFWELEKSVLYILT